MCIYLYTYKVLYILSMLYRLLYNRLHRFYILCILHIQILPYAHITVFQFYTCLYHFTIPMCVIVGTFTTHISHLECIQKTYTMRT